MNQRDHVDLGRDHGVVGCAIDHVILAWRVAADHCGLRLNVRGLYDGRHGLTHISADPERARAGVF